FCPGRPQGLMSATLSGRAFANCSTARAAGTASVRRGEPDYGRHFDRDGDGVGGE
ncbi:MAG: excalibur calcium-binding domain-containing protein, partial [Alphaproteobacteria bacterium]